MSSRGSGERVVWKGRPLKYVLRGSFLLKLLCFLDLMFMFVTFRDIFVFHRRSSLKSQAS